MFVTFFIVKTRRKTCVSCSGQFLKKSCKQKPRAKHQFPSKTSSETQIFKQNLEQNSDFQAKPRAKQRFSSKTSSETLISNREKVILKRKTRAKTQKRKKPRE